MIVVVDGNIGSGKSTLLKKLSSAFHVVTEKIHDWPLDEFYNDPRRWAFTLQVKILQSMSRPDDTGHTIIHERCPQSSNFVFWKHFVDSKQVTETENRVYQDVYAMLEWKSDIYIYLRCSPEKCFQNVQKRTQAGDSGVNLDYIRCIHERYEEFMKHLPNVCIIDADQDETTVYNNICDILGCRKLCT